VSPSPNEARVVIRDSALTGAVLSRVVGMLAARALCPIDRLDDALLVTDAIAAHAERFSAQGAVGVTVSADGGGLAMRVGPLRPEGAEGLLRAADLPGVGNVLEQVADEIQAGASGDGDELLIRLAFQAA